MESDEDGTDGTYFLNMSHSSELTKLVTSIDMYSIANWPVIHSEAVEARDNIIETHRVVPLPIYDATGALIPPSR